jgi:hypothetical protein
MADWLLHSLFQIGGTAALLTFAGVAAGKWLLKKIDAALESYNKAYHEQKGAIDARIDRIEKLVEEQARLTRTVESIKDEIAAGAKSRDNRWAFRKDTYVSLIKATSDLISAQLELMGCARRYSQLNVPGVLDTEEGIVASANEASDRSKQAIRAFLESASLAPLAVADSVADAIRTVNPRLDNCDLRDPEAERHLQEGVELFRSLLLLFHSAGRKDLWGTPEPTLYAQAATSE